MNMRRFPKTKLALALVSVMLGGMAASNVAQAVQLANDDRLGDGAVFQYFTAKDDWQTFIRLINTSANSIVVKMRFREAANSREVLDFEVALSPYDAWTAWTSKDARGAGIPGIRTNDKSCLFPLPGSSAPGEGWEPRDANGVTTADFKSRAFTGVYDDGAGLDPVARMSEGHIEVIGIAEFDPSRLGLQGEFARAVIHDDEVNDGGAPDCRSALEIWRSGAARNFGLDMDNVLATNAYLINVNQGQGAGYDPDMLADCSARPLSLDAIQTDTDPDWDSCNPGDFDYDFTGDGVEDAARNQMLSNGTEAPVTITTIYQVDLNASGDYLQTFNVDLSGDLICNGNELGIREANVPAELYTAARAQNVIADIQANSTCDYLVVADNSGPVYLTNTLQVERPGRIKQKGQAGRTPVQGGVDWVSEELMRTSVINEWAASANPGAAIKDYYTQWVLTFPTKHYYVDLQNDGNTGDDISPTLVDVGNGLAFAPFTTAFPANGMSCEPYAMSVYNREEREIDFTSPAPNAPAALCYETQVLTFNERYETSGLDSNFAITIPALLLPREVDGSLSERGWAQLNFIGRGAEIGLNDFWWDYLGLPVTGFMLSVYETGNVLTNHTAINAHKYTRQTVPCTPGVDRCQMR